MVELVGGALLSGLFNVVFDRIASKEVSEFFRGKKIVAELLFELKARLGSANKLLSDAEAKQIDDGDVRHWLNGLREVVYDADHLLDKINTEALRRKREDSSESSAYSAAKLRSFISNFVGAFDQNVRLETAEINKKLKVLLDQTSHLGLKEHAGARVSSERSLSPLVEESDVCGRAVDKDAIVELLLSDKGSKISVVPIVGMGGIGKTTLARLVYDDAVVREHFVLFAWVVVSESERFDVARIAREILDSIDAANSPRRHGGEDPSKLQTDLKSALRGKKFLIVLDDVWCDNYDQWDILRSSFKSGEHGSKIIVTSRSKSVAVTMGTVPEYDLRTISDDDCWKLFARHVGFANIPNPDPFREVGSKIVEKCKGLPLAVKSIAGVLRSSSDPEEWRRVLNSDTWEVPRTNVLPALLLSYQSLSPNLKRCFAYLSMFPKGYEFDEGEREKLVLLWIAQAILQEEKGRRLEEVGRDNLNALISRSFFHRSTRDASTFLMHDLLHDLAVRVSGEPSLVLHNNNALTEAEKIHHLLYWKSRSGHESPSEKLLNGIFSSEAKSSLRTFLAIPLSPSTAAAAKSSLPDKVIWQVLSSCSRLRVLSLSGFSVTRLPDSLDGLKYLRYLDLSGTKLESVPNSVASLCNLQTLLLSRCEKLTRLPANTSNLISLRRLDVDETPLLEMPPKIDSLSRSLRSLSDFVVGKRGGSRLRELGELRNLHGTLRISKLENVSEPLDASLAGIREKDSLSGLILRWGSGDADDSRKEREILSEFQPGPNLKELEIDGFRGTIFPEWLGDGAVAIAGAAISRCPNCVMLPPLGKLRSLRRLRIREMGNLAAIGDEFCGNDRESGDGEEERPFAALEELSIEDVMPWKEWSFSRGVVFENGRFPALKHIRLEYCRRLVTGLPAGGFPSLKTVEIVTCRSMEAVFPRSRVPIDAAFPALESIKIWRCPKLKIFSKKGLPSTLRVLEVHDDCETLFANRQKWGLQRLSSLNHLELSGCRTAVESFPEDGLLPPNLSRLRIDGFRSLRSLDGAGLRRLTSLRQLSICGCGSLQGIPDEGLPASLSYLRIVQCQLLSHRCRRDVGEDWNKIRHVPLIIINRQEI